MPQAYLESCRISKMEHFRAFSEYANECGEDDLNRNLQMKDQEIFLHSFISLSLKLGGHNVRMRILFLMDLWCTFTFQHQGNVILFSTRALVN